MLICCARCKIDTWWLRSTKFHYQLTNEYNRVRVSSNISLSHHRYSVTRDDISKLNHTRRGNAIVWVEAKLFAELSLILRNQKWSPFMLALDETQYISEDLFNAFFPALLVTRTVIKLRMDERLSFETVSVFAKSYAYRKQ